MPSSISCIQGGSVKRYEAWLKKLLEGDVGLAGTLKLLGEVWLSDTFLGCPRHDGPLFKKKKVKIGLLLIYNKQENSLSGQTIYNHSSISQKKDLHQKLNHTIITCEHRY